MTYLVGRQIGRYHIQEEIGRGGMARVYRALDTSLQRMVALKILAPQLAVDPEFAQRFHREAVIAASLRHPNIVLIFDVGEDDNMHYIAMEFVEGRTLHAIIQERGALGLGPAVSIVEGVGAALDHAHERGAIHRDIKPHNVMVDTSGRVLLTDFGIAQPPDRGDGAERLTRTGVFMGTPEYISPEQASGQKLDGRSDLYSLGITAYEIITGRVPFSGATPQLIVAHVQEPPPPPTSVDTDLPWELDAVIARILAKRPENRFRTAEAFAEALRIVARKRGYAPATRAQLAGFAKPRSTAGQSTAAINRDVTQRGQPPLPVPVAVPVVAQAAPSAMPATEAAERMPPRSRPRAMNERAAPHVQQAPRSESAPRTAGRTVRPAPPPTKGWNRDAWTIGLVVGLVVIGVLAAFLSRPTDNGGNNPFVPTLTSVPPPTNKPTVTRTPTPTATNTPLPTDTPVPPTFTPVPPTFTTAPIFVPPAPTFTPVPFVPSDTPVPPTEEPATVVPTVETPIITPDVPTVTTEPPPENPTTEPGPTIEATISTVAPTVALTAASTAIPTEVPTVASTPTEPLAPTPEAPTEAPSVATP